MSISQISSFLTFLTKGENRFKASTELIFNQWEQRSNLVFKLGRETRFKLFLSDMGFYLSLLFVFTWNS